MSTLHFTGIGPFDEVDFKFDPHINVFVGPNNCGKSTVLFALADLCVFPFTVPRKLLHDQAAAFSASFLQKGRKRVLEGAFPIIYSEASGNWPREKFTQWDKNRKQLGYTNFVPALRWSTDYRSKGPIPPRKDDRRHGPFVIDEDGDVVPASQPQEEDTRSSLVRDEQIVQEIVELDYRAYRQDKPSMRGLLNEIAALASEITEGFPIEFSGIAEDKRGLYPEFDTPDGKMPLDVLSQGTQSLIQWLARLLIGYAKQYDFPARLRDKPGILIIDEIDAHLHPSWQRRILPAVTTHFPSLQIFCSTHSPLMLAGLRAGQVHLLARDRKGKVTISRNDTDILGWSADEILTGFLGVESATDLDSEKTLQRLQELRAKKRLTGKQRAELESLRDTVNERLLRGPAAEELAQLTDRINRSRAGPSVTRSSKSKRSGKKRTARRAAPSTRSRKKAAK
ncbi:MAG: AAA family ATPase [Planctomycetes bacterium]|nr:AAA family ATPase [Planctomycetota bacterium]